VSVRLLTHSCSKTVAAVDPVAYLHRRPDYWRDRINR
jgi:hypothetical protein